ncbi:MAG: hypothetical protein MJ121_04635, partial [Clostridia bacterium]|nr:hypothetical protein [Clostridia bacterium]
CTGANPRYPLMSEIKQMYLNAYYGNKHFEEPEMPSAESRLRSNDADKTKQAYVRARNGKKKN